MASSRAENLLAIARKAICLARGLSGADKAVAAAILDHFNKKTQQCDPSNERLAVLLDLDQRTVRRSTAELSGTFGLFVKRSHGGKSCRASYTPVWSAFKAIVDDWERRMRGLDEPETEGGNRAEMPGSDDERTGQNCPANRAILSGKQGRNALQTHYKNPSIEPISPKAPAECDAETLDRSSLESPSQGLLRREKAEPKPAGYEASERAATSGCSRSDAAWKAAQRRIEAAIASAPPDWRHELWSVIMPDQMDHAIRSEIKRRGEGVASLNAAMRMARLTVGRDAHVH